ncbi:hypothetical protein [Nocardioides sp. MH1]|uniref:hypothetical protein n=1 Tax=Nocardioides sp. MH1 TaxID=3242490 RepID=UPI0035222E7B
MTTLQHPVSAPLRSPRFEEPQTHDNYVLATRVVHRAETLLEAAHGYPLAVAHIETAFELALEVTDTSTWAEIGAASDHLEMAQDELERGGYRFR